MRFAETWIPPEGATLDQAQSVNEDIYSYDALNRLSSVTEARIDVAGGWVWQQQFRQAYSYDRYGNRTIDAVQTWGTGINNKQFEVEPTTNRLQVPTSQAGVLTYDFAGNLITDTYTGAGAREYDAENRMTRAWGGTNQWQYYTYNADGQRTRRKVNDQETWQIHGMDGELLAEYPANSAAASPQKEYGYRNGQLLITASSSQRQWLVSDHLGTPRMVIDQTGSLANMKRHDYLPFGEELGAGVGGRAPGDGYTSGDGVRQQFTQKERDVETGLDYFLARYYSSTQGRFTSPDEFAGGPDELYVLSNRDGTKQALPYADITKPQSLNKYQYCYNNPLNYVDPDGHDALYVVDKDKGTTTIVIPVHFTGANATRDLIAEVIKRGSELDTGDPGVKIQIVSTDKPIAGVLNTMDLSQGKDFKNYWAGEGVNRVGGNKGHVDTNGVGRGGGILHETLHFAGLKDRYHETTRDPKKGRGKPTPHKGYDNTNIMAASGGTTLKPAQIKEARQNRSTKKCSVENGSMKCK